MKAEVHYDKAQRLSQTQAILDPAQHYESIVELCYMSTHHYILAGTEWVGTPHHQSHAHRDNARLLKAAAPQAILDAWNDLEKYRAGYIYGAKDDITVCNDARQALDQR